jgi:hypothetical protein
MRTLSLTSSAIDKLLIAAAKYIGPDHELYEHFKRVLEYAGQAHLLANANAAAAAEDEDQSTESDDEVMSISDEMVQRLLQPQRYSDIHE